MKEKIKVVVIIYLVINLVFGLIALEATAELFKEKKAKDCDLTINHLQSISDYVLGITAYMGIKIGCELARPRFNLDNQTK